MHDLCLRHRDTYKLSPFRIVESVSFSSSFHSVTGSKVWHAASGRSDQLYCCLVNLSSHFKTSKLLKLFNTLVQLFLRAKFTQSWIFWLQIAILHHETLKRWIKEILIFWKKDWYQNYEGLPAHENVGHTVSLWQNAPSLLYLNTIV